MKADNEIHPLRIALLAAIPIILCCVILAALYGLQAVNSADYLEESLNSAYRTETVPAARGDLLDRYGRVLVTNRVSYDLTIQRSRLVTDPNPNGIILALIDLVAEKGIRHTDTLPLTLTAPFDYTAMSETQRSRLNDYVNHFGLGESVRPDELMQWFRAHYSIPESYSDADARLAAGVRWELELRALFGIADYVFASGLDTDLIAAILERCYPGVSVVTGSVREYKTTYAAHLLGRVGAISEDQLAHFQELGYPLNAVVGQDGAEAAFEEYLHGTDGQRVTVRNAAGEITGSYYTVEPKAGSDVRLTIDLDCQQVTEDALARAVRRINEDRLAEAKDVNAVQLAQTGAAVVVQVGTGDLLASASYPSYDLSRFYEDYEALSADPTAPMFNRAMQGTYAPGSTFKPVTAAAALSEGVITPETKIYDRGILDDYEGDSFTCWIYPGSHGNINVKEALQMSCNYFFYTVGRELGVDKLDEYAEAFGLGQPTGIELPERSGILASQEYKKSAVGEEWYIGDTIQAAIGQSYHLFTPLQLATYAATLASGGVRYETHLLSGVNGENAFTFQPAVADTVEASADAFRVIKEGMYMASRYGSAAYVFGDYEIPVCSKTGTAQVDEKRENNAVFIAFAPMEEPEIALAIVVESGANGYYLAEVARDIFDWYFSQKTEPLPMQENARNP